MRSFLILLVLCIAAAPLPAANLIVNGGFENGNYTGGDWTRVSAGSTALTGWTVGGVAVDWHNAVEMQMPHGGDKVLDLHLDGGAGQQGAISQTFATTPGQIYRLEFYLSGPGLSFPNPRRVTVSIAGITQTFSAPASSNMSIVWTQQQLPFVATGSTTTLTFSSPHNGQGFWGPVLDDVSVDVGSPLVTLTRPTLTTVRATGAPAGGTFTYTSRTLAGANVATVALASGVTPTTNPNTVTLTAPGGTGAPTAAGLEEITVQYAVAGRTASQVIRVATFGMSCYMTTLESDYGVVPDGCITYRIAGRRYAGTVTNPSGLTGVYCSSFIAMTKLQGSGLLNTGQYVQYNPGNDMLAVVPQVLAADQTPVVAGQTLARDRAVIAGIGVHLDVDQLGNGLLANDVGGAIVGYRLDLFNGSGDAACANYTNPIRVAVCDPPQPGSPQPAVCPGRLP